MAGFALLPMPRMDDGAGLRTVVQLDVQARGALGVGEADGGVRVLWTQTWTSGNRRNWQTA